MSKHQPTGALVSTTNPPAPALSTQSQSEGGGGGYIHHSQQPYDLMAVIKIAPPPQDIKTPASPLRTRKISISGRLIRCEQTGNPHHRPVPAATHPIPAFSVPGDAAYVFVRRQAGLSSAPSSALHGDPCRRSHPRHLEELELLVSDAEEVLDGAEVGSPDGRRLFKSSKVHSSIVQSRY